MYPTCYKLLLKSSKSQNGDTSVKVEDKYTAYVYNIFVRPKKIEFKVSDVKVPDIPGMFTTFKAKDVPLFVEGSQFQDRSHYGKIMGYDKPLDLK